MNQTQDITKIVVPYPNYGLIVGPNVFLNGTTADPLVVRNIEYSAAQTPFFVEIMPMLDTEEVKREYYPFLERVEVMEELKKTPG